jgi:putative transposase
MERLSEEKGFHIQKVNPSYTSQQCSSCGLIDKSNRNGENYKCGCGTEMDADINAAKNILQRGDYNPSSFEPKNLLTSL